MVEVVMDEPATSYRIRPSRGSSISSQVSSQTEEFMANPRREGTKRRRISDEGKESGDERREVSAFDDVRKERNMLEEFLFNEANRVNKVAIKFILDRWKIIENKLQDEILENEKLKIRIAYQRDAPDKTLNFAQALASCPSSLRPGMEHVPERNKTKKENYEVLLIRPEKEDDKRSNDDIRMDVTKSLNSVRGQLKVRGIRQMRNKGIVIEVKDKNDVELINEAKLEKIGLKIDKPKKLSPSIIIYDVEKDYKVEDLKEDLIKKNFDTNNEKELDELRNGILFRHCFKSKENRVNWIVQVPGRVLASLVNKGRIFMLWRVYRVKEYLNIIRCFKCHAYGHFAKFCNAPDQLCETCGSKDHLKTNCDKKEAPRCANCVRFKRRDVNHDVRNKSCPEYVKYLEIYRNKLECG